MFRKISILALVLVSLSALAQKPAWTDYYKRIEMYPDNEFIVGFVSGVVEENEDSGSKKSVYESMAKDKVVQSIQVEIETNNSLLISNTNGKSNEGFVSNSVSVSKADVAGLNTQSFYDRRKKEVFAISTVNRKELAFYYRNKIKSSREDIEQLLKQGREYVKKGMKEIALKTFYGAMPLLMNIDQARALLISLNRKMYADIDMDEVNKLNLDINNEITNLLSPNELTLSETAYFIAYGLYLQLGEITSEINIVGLFYENTGLVSNFSEKFMQEFASALVDAGNYKIGSGNVSMKYTHVTGNYWKEGGYIKISASAYQNEKLLAVSKGSLPISWLANEKIDYLPEQIKLMNALEGFRISLKSAPSSVKLGIQSEVPIELLLTDNHENESNPKEGFPIEIVDAENSDFLCGSVTDRSGIAACYLPEINTENKIIKVIAEVNLSEYLNIDRESLYYAIASIQNPVNLIELDLVTERPTIFITSSEKLQGKQMDIKTLEPTVKETLSESGYNFVSDKADADYIITINANTTTGTKYDGIYFAYLDVNLSVMNTSINEEIFKTHLDQIKGGGINYGKAEKKAYLVGSKKIKESIQNSILIK